MALGPGGSANRHPMGNCVPSKEYNVQERLSAYCRVAGVTRPLLVILGVGLHNRYYATLKRTKFRNGLVDWKILLQTSVSHNRPQLFECGEAGHRLVDAEAV